MKRTFFLIVLSTWLGLFSIGFSETLALASWNLMHLGWGKKKNYGQVATVASHFDFLAIQEAMNKKGVIKLEVALQKETHAGWGCLISHTEGRGRYQESYAFLWRKDKVKYAGQAALYLDTNHAFARAPFSAEFATANGAFHFTVATVHVRFGKGKKDRTGEIAQLATYWAWLGATFPRPSTKFLMGDFNLAYTSPAFAPLKKSASPLITNGKSTLSAKGTRYANLYDNIWVGRPAKVQILRAGIYRYPEKLNVTHQYARRHISDHAPVYVTLQL